MNTNSFTWGEGRGGNKLLYLGTKFTGTSVRPHPEYEDLYYIITKKGDSTDFYNISRAKQHALDLTIEDLTQNMV